MASSWLWYPAGADLAGDGPLVLHDETHLPSRVLRAVQGADAPPWRVSWGSVPGVPGGFVTSVDTDPRTMVIPVLVEAGSLAEVRRFRARLIAAMNPEAGDGTLVHGVDLGTPDGEMRRTPARYVDGLRGDGSQEAPTWWRFTVSLQCLDPYWYSMDPVTASWAGPVTASFLPFSLPFELAASELTVETALEVSGDAPSWPTLRLTAPFLRAKVIHSDGRSWQILRGAELSERSLTVVTKPGARSVRDEFGASAWDQLTGELFPLNAGDQVSVEVDGQGAETRVDLSMDEAWLTS